ncbi:MAG: hypothetical protein WC967_13670 [Balneolaceae bacterium]
MRKLFSISLFFFLCSCGPISLEEDPIVKKHFSESEIAYLDSILTFFDNEVVKQTPDAEIIPSYKELFKVVKDSVKSAPVIAIEIDQKKYQRLFSTMPDSFQQKLWYTGYAHDSRSNDSTFYRDLRSSGTYAAFLKNASEKNSFLFEYYDDLVHGASLTPTMNANMLYYPEKLDIEKERERLIYAVHFITLRRPSAH